MIWFGYLYEWCLSSTWWTLRGASVATTRWLEMFNRRVIQSTLAKRSYLFIHVILLGVCPLVKVWSLGLVSKHWNTVSNKFCYMFACCHFYFRLQLLLIIIHITCISLSLRRTSAHIHLTSVLGVLGTQETFCIVIAGLLERDSFDLFLPEFDKPWVIHLRETCCCSTNLCTWRPNTVYKNRRVRRHQLLVVSLEALLQTSW